MIFQYFDLADFRKLLEGWKALNLQPGTLGGRTLEEIEKAILPFEDIEAGADNEEYMPDELQSAMADLHFPVQRMKILVYVQNNTPLDYLNLAVKK